MPDQNPLPPDRRVPGAPDSPGDTSPSQLNGGVDVGEYINVGTDQNAIQVTEAEDGGAYVDFPGHEQESTPPNEGFYTNLAEVIPETIQQRVVSDLLRKIEADKEARTKRDEQYAEGVKRTGLGKDAPGGAEFEGASRAVHPMMTEACIDYESRIIKELWPPSGPVKPLIVGATTQEKTDKAKRVTEHLNYQITRQIKEARSVLEETLTQVPLGGSQFIRQWWDHRLKRPRWEFVPVDKVYLPYGAASAASAHRITYADTISAVEFKQRVDQGMYRDVGTLPTATQPELSKTEQATQKVDGVDDPAVNLDGDREVYETMVVMEVTDDIVDLLEGDEVAGELYPFLVHIDVSTRTMLGFYRSWEDGDEAREPIEHLFEFPFLPWRGAYAIGFPQIIGGLSAAATGALRALLDSAHINNAAGGFILKGSGAGGQTRRPSIGEFAEIDGGLETDDIRKRVMPFAMNQPSPVLFQLLGFVVDAAKGVVRTSLDETPTDGGAAVPVGTQMSRVEEGLVVFSAIHGRAHAAFNRLLTGLHRLNRLYLPNYLKVDADGTELMVRRADYEGPCDVQAVSDPTIYSDQQRWAQLGYIQSRMQINPALWKAREVELAGLKLIKWPNPEAILADQPQPHELNQVNENLAMALGQPVQVFPEQDHLAHLHALFEFMQSPMLGMNPLIAPVFLPRALKHAAEHIVYLYVKTTVTTVGKAAGVDAAQLMSNDTTVKALFDTLLATASKPVVAEVQQSLSPYNQVMQQAMALVKQLTPPPPLDPSAAALQVAQAETQRKAAADAAGHALDTTKVQTDAQLEQQRIGVDAARTQATIDAATINANARLAESQQDNQTALDISEAKIASGEGSNYVNGNSLNYKP